MDQNERLKLQRQYEKYADVQILEMLEEGPDAFVEGAYRLIKEEALRRGISPNAPGPEIPRESPRPEAPGGETGGLPETFIEIMVINARDDQEAVAQVMERTGIPYHFMKMSITGKELPAALMVDQRRVEEAMERLQRAAFPGSIVLW